KSDKPETTQPSPTDDTPAVEPEQAPEPVSEQMSGPEPPAAVQATVDVDETGKVEEEPLPPSQPEPAAKPGFFARIKQGLSRTSNNFAEGLGTLILGRKIIDDELLEEIESQLLIADVGMDA